MQNHPIFELTCRIVQTAAPATYYFYFWKVLRNTFDFLFNSYMFSLKYIWQSFCFSWVISLLSFYGNQAGPKTSSCFPIPLLISLYCTGPFVSKSLFWYSILDL